MMPAGPPCASSTHYSFGESTIRYSLWSHGRLLGHTDLDMPCVTPHFMQGFVEPTPDGSKILPRATGVPKAVSATRNRKLDKAELEGRRAEFLAACARREAMDFELRDENDVVLQCEFMRVYDLRDESWLDDMEDEEPLDPELQEQVDRDVEEILEARADKWGSGWPPPAPPDPRWDTMQYHIQVYLERDRYDFGFECDSDDW
jgi:hypothetical protein